MHATCLDMQRAAPNCQEAGRPHVRPANETEGTLPMMTQPPLDTVTFSSADQATIAPMLENWYRECLTRLRFADKVRKAADLPAPAEALELYAYLLPRQVVSH